MRTCVIYVSWFCFFCCAARFTALVLALFALSAEAFNFGGKPKASKAIAKAPPAKTAVSDL